MDTFTPNQIDQIKSLIRNEGQSNYFSGTPSTEPHTHNGVDTPRVSQRDIISSLGAMGKITFSRSTTYTLFFPTPGATQITFNGFATKSGGAIYALVVGQAVLKNTYYFQPLNNSSVEIGGMQYPITQNGVVNQPAQCSSSLYIDTSAADAVFNDTVNQFQFIDVFDPTPTQVAKGTLNNLTNKSVDLIVTLATNWSIVGNFTII